MPTISVSPLRTDLAQLLPRVESRREQVLVPDLGLEPALLRLSLRPLTEDGSGAASRREGQLTTQYGGVDLEPGFRP